MNQFGLAFHHLGLAVKRTDRAFAFMQGLGYRIGPQVYDPLQRVNLAMCDAPVMPSIEVISPADVPGPLDPILRYHSELVYHMCYATADLAESLAMIKSDGHRITEICKPTPAILFSGRLVSFYLVYGFGVIEILQEESVRSEMDPRNKESTECSTHRQITTASQ
jgi:hypothetical protein